MPIHVVLTVALLLAGVMFLFVLVGRFDKEHGGQWTDGLRLSWRIGRIVVPLMAVAFVFWLTQTR